MKSTAKIEVKVIPGAKKSEWVSYEGGKWKIRIQAPPEKGKANEELISFLSKELSIPKKQFTITSGLTSRLKKVEVEGILPDELESKLLNKLL